MAKSPRRPKNQESNEARDLESGDDISPKAEIIPAPIRDALVEAGLDLTKSEIQAVVTTLLHESKFSGPLPPASMLAEYDAVRPGLAQEIIGWAQQQQAHRRGLELMAFRGSESRMNRAQVFALVVALASLAAGLGAAYFGANSVAMAFALVGIGGPSTATVLARILDRRILSERHPVTQRETEHRGQG